MNLRKFIALTVIVHVILCLSVFDIYFTTPVIHGAEDFEPEASAPASRLVLFVADGLRADTFFTQISETPNSYLRKIVNDHGMWGVSHTRPPTESRPCHVAMTSGFYEDASAIYERYKKNPVEFDNAFNKSRNTWAFGSYEVIPIFGRGDTLSHYHMHVYYGNSDDEWVFNTFASFISGANPNSHLHDSLLEDRIIFFLHLVATDTYGHRFGASSPNYASNVKRIDAGIAKTIQILDNFYNNDGRTTYMLVSDHGMTDQGSHGRGSRDETSSPLVVWGSGVEKHKTNASASLSDEDNKQTRLWKLNPSDRIDVQQVDLAPLMASLIGVPVPANSMGILPVDYLSVKEEDKAKLLLSNARQTTELFRVRQKKAAGQSILPLPFFKLTTYEANTWLQRINQSITAKRYSKAMFESEKLIRVSLEGAYFYHIHHRFSLCFVVILSFIGWILVAAIAVFQSNSDLTSETGLNERKFIRKLFICFLIAELLILLAFSLLRLKFTYFFYYTLPLFICYYVFSERKVIQSSVSNISLKASTFFLALILVGLLILSFFHRKALTIILILFALGGSYTTVPIKVRLMWVFACTFCFIFPCLPVIKAQMNTLIVLFTALLVLVFSYVMKPSKKYASLSILPLLSGVIICVVRYYPKSHSSFISALSWSVLTLSWFLPLFTPTNLVDRIVSLFSCHAASYLLLCFSYDSFFFVVFCSLLAAWVIMEVHLIKEQSKPLKEINLAATTPVFDSDLKFSSHSFRQSVFFVFFLIFALFALENTESIAHFNTNLLFVPFKMPGFAFLKPALLYYKISLPYLMLTLALLCINVSTSTNLKHVFCCAVSISDVMAVCFLFLIRDSNVSWLQTSLSLSHYIISMSLVMSLPILFPIGRFLLTVKLC